MPLAPLPIDDVLPQLLAALRGHSAAVLQAPTGAGKTTRVPPAILDAGLAGERRILVLEPRRLAARAAARRIAFERGGRVGDEIGYHVRFDKQTGPRTRIAVVTPGILLRYLHDDPFLDSTALVVFDEFHERGLESDLALGMVRLLQQTVRTDLKIVVMSATLDTAGIAAYLGGAPVVVSEGRLHPVEILYEPKPPAESWPVATAKAIGRVLRRTEGDVLVFLPGMGEICQSERELAPLAEKLDMAVLPLHGDLPAEQQDAALVPQSRRKIVLSTNVAETSVTVSGVTGVVDTGLARVLTFDPAIGLDRLDLAPISKSSADQRAGRAGRERPGVCVRLWSEGQHLGRAEQIEPEIRRVDLAGALLHLLTLGEAHVERFPWLDPPPPATVTSALQLLHRLGAVDEAGPTELGRMLVRLPVHPRLARLLVEGARLGCPEQAAMAAAILAERSPFLRATTRPAFGRRAGSSSDVLDAVEAIEEFERTGRVDSICGELHRGAGHFILRARDQLMRAISEANPGRPAPGRRPPASAAGLPLLQALYAAFPDRLARRRNPGGEKAVMIGGRGVRLAPTSGVLDGELFVCIDVDAGQIESLVRMASRVERDWLPSDQLVQTVDMAFDPKSERVTARRRVRIEDLVLEDREAPLPETADVARVLAAAALERFDSVFPADDSVTGRYLIRLRCLANWMPELHLPNFDDAEMRDLLVEMCTGCQSLADLRKADWLGVIQGRLKYPQLQTIERESPERLAVPSGSRLALSYEVGRPPVLAVRMQELFGLTATPRIAGGRVPVLLHLLAPNGRPQQVTDDLASFWANTYPQVRKDLRARYPKHAWPEDPLSAQPTSRPKKKPS
jgi:ATP-dependent RNA helicase HrpB